ncbi:MAG TPA: protein kinase [Pyrinomonadaceae bacterium]|nr:protein kinase [Pyrinomonadaceae bacterium]
MSLDPGTRLGRYEVRSKIGAGGMGEVYRAHDAKIGRDVAIKVLPADFAGDKERLARFEQEAQAAGALNHPNILSIHDVETHDGSPYVVSELLEGETLREALSGASLPVRKAVDYALQSARGLAAAHERGIIHRDIKPENLFVTTDGRVKILDFGIAKLMEPGAGVAPTDLPTRRVNTDAGAVMGTVGYMSPEQLRGQQVDPRTDIFSFGAVLYEMFAGRRAFQRDSAADTISAILKEDPPELSETNKEVNPALDRVVRRCLEKNREQRFHSASDLAFALESLSGSPGAGATAVTATGRATAGAATPERRRKLIDHLGWSAAAILLVSTLALAFLHFRRAEPRTETMRFALLAPEKTAYRGEFALSPDGRRLAFIATGVGGRSLWVRALDSVEARELQGTADAAFPFWSPDGRFIGFFAGNRLKRIDIVGGSPQALAEVTADSRGGAWGADGTIIFTPNFTSPLLKVSATGGKAEPVTELDQARGHTSHRWPSFLPDGRRFIYFARTTRKEAEGVYVGSVDSKEGKFLLNTNLLAAYAPAGGVTNNAAAGYLLFMRESTLMAQPFDAGRMQLSGEPFAVVEGVVNVPGEGGPTGYAAFSASANGHLSYLKGSASQSQMGWFDRAGKSLGPVGSPGLFAEPWQSPDGKRIVFGRTDLQSPDLWQLDLERGTTTRFTFDAAADACPVWSSDGSRVFFSSNRGGNIFSLYQKIASGAGGDELLLKTDYNTFADDCFSGKAGEFLLYEIDGPQGRFDLWVLPLTGERKPYPFLQTEFNETHSQFSPDGRFVAYVSDESGRAEVYVQSFPASGGKWQISTTGGDQPQWRRDGRELFYLAPDKTLMAVPVAAGDSFEPGSPVALFATRVPGGSLTGDRNHFVAAADGQRFLVNNLVDEGNTQPLTLVLNWAASLKR